MTDLKPFFDYCASKKPDFLPVRAGFIGVGITTTGNIILSKECVHCLPVPRDKIFELEADLKAFLQKDGYFLYNKKKARTIKTLINP